MADSSTRITNMPDGGSPERVAFDLMQIVRVNEGNGKMTRTAILDLYTQCLDATKGYRKLKPDA